MQADPGSGTVWVPVTMTDEDTRSLPAPAQAALRNRAVRAVLDGMTQAEAARVFGVHHNAVNRWVKRYRQGGWDGLSERRRGRRPGEQAALAEPQQQEVIALVRDATPDQLGLAGFLWTREAVAELIARRYGRWLARTTVGAYLRGWGFSPQKPQRRALEQNPAAVRRWLAEIYPAIRAQARREGGMVLCWTRWGSARMRRPADSGHPSVGPRSSRRPASASGST
jgi:transposase